MITGLGSLSSYSRRTLRLTVPLVTLLVAHQAAGLRAALAAAPAAPAPAPAAAAPAASVPATPAERTEPLRASRSDRRFVLCAAEANQSEIRLSERALVQAASPEVRHLAGEIIRQHLKAGAELQGLATGRGIVISPNEYNHRAVYRLSQKEGRKFDEAYLDTMVDCHEEAVEKFRKSAEKCDDPELRAFASKTLPTLQAHLQHARRLDEKLF